MNRPRQYVTTITVARLRGVTVRAVTSWCQLDRIPGADQVGYMGTWRIPVEALAERVPMRSRRGRRIVRNRSHLRITTYRGGMQVPELSPADIRGKITAATSELTDLRADLDTLEAHRSETLNTGEATATEERGRRHATACRLVNAQHASIRDAERELVALKYALSTHLTLQAARGAHLVAAIQAARTPYRL